MFRLREALSPSARALLARERVLTPVPATTRARALGRARAAVSERLAALPLPSRGLLTIRTAACLLCLATVAGGAAAYEVGLRALPAPAHADAAPLPAPAHESPSSAAARTARSSCPTCLRPLGHPRDRPRARGDASSRESERRGGARGLRGGDATARRARASLPGRVAGRGARGVAGEGASRSRPDLGGAPRCLVLRGPFSPQPPLAAVSQIQRADPLRLRSTPLMGGDGPVTRIARGGSTCRSSSAISARARFQACWTIRRASDRGERPPPRSRPGCARESRCCASGRNPGDRRELGAAAARAGGHI